LDDRQDIIGQVSSFQAPQPEEAAQGRKNRPHTRIIQPFIPISLFLSGGSPLSGGAATYHNNEIAKGGLDDE
jgi:hypothetical protein